MGNERLSGLLRLLVAMYKNWVAHTADDETQIEEGRYLYTVVLFKERKG